MTNYNYKMTDCGKSGKTFERDLKAMFNQRAIVSKQGKIDFRRDRLCYEVKTGAGELDYLLNSKIKYVIYVPVVNDNADISRQEGFILTRESFLDTLDSLGLIREKTATNGLRKVTIQTFWNAKQGKPHGSKYYKLVDVLYETCIMTLEEYFENNGKLD